MTLGRIPDSNQESSMFRSRVLFPLEGRAPITYRRPGTMCPMIRSKSLKPHEVRRGRSVIEFWPSIGGPATVGLLRGPFAKRLSKLRGTGVHALGALEVDRPVGKHLFLWVFGNELLERRADVTPGCWTLV